VIWGGVCNSNKVLLQETVEALSLLIFI